MTMLKPSLRHNAPLSSIKPPWWDDAPAIVVGAGPSLAGTDLGRLRGLGHVIAVNESYHDLPFADLIFSLDTHFMGKHAEDLANHTPQVLYAVPQNDDIGFLLTEGALYVERRRDEYSTLLSLDPSWIQSGGNSGFGAFNVAVLKRAKIIYLFGLDYTSDHYCPERYTHQPRNHNERYYPRWARVYEKTLPILERIGTRVINASPKSNLTVFPRCTVEEGIRQLEEIRDGKNNLRSEEVPFI